MRLQRDLFTIYGDLLVKKDEEITPATAKRLRTMGEDHKQVRVPLKNTDIFTDFERIFDDDRYAIMFQPPVGPKEIIHAASSLMIENDLIFELSNMKNNLPYTYRHVLTIAAFAIKVARLYRPKDIDEEIISHCGFTHDIGKTRIPISILNKKEKLTEAERALLETHPTIGYLLLNYYLKKDRVDCSLASLEHHEKLDGTGYPQHITKISKYTQIITPVDIMDALMTKRPYRSEVFTLRAALDYLLREANAGRINKDIVLLLISCARKTKPDFQTMKISEKQRDQLPEELTHDKYQ